MIYRAVEGPQGPFRKWLEIVGVTAEKWGGGEKGPLDDEKGQVSPRGGAEGLWGRAAAFLSGAPAEGRQKMRSCLCRAASGYGKYPNVVDVICGGLGRDF